jgi:hypothetical protein
MDLAAETAMRTACALVEATQGGQIIMVDPSFSPGRNPRGSVASSISINIGGGNGSSSNDRNGGAGAKGTGRGKNKAAMAAMGLRGDRAVSPTGDDRSDTNNNNNDNNTNNDNTENGSIHGSSNGHDGFSPTGAFRVETAGLHHLKGVPGDLPLLNVITPATEDRPRPPIRSVTQLQRLAGQQLGAAGIIGLSSTSRAAQRAGAAHLLLASPMSSKMLLGSVYEDGAADARSTATRSRRGGGGGSSVYDDDGGDDDDDDTIDIDGGGSSSIARTTFEAEHAGTSLARAIGAPRRSTLIAASVSTRTLVAPGTSLSGTADGNDSGSDADSGADESSVRASDHGDRDNDGNGAERGTETALVATRRGPRPRSAAPVAELDERAPRGKVTLVLLTIPSAAILWEVHPESMLSATVTFSRIVHKCLADNRGYQVSFAPPAGSFAFASSRRAALFVAHLMTAMQESPWPHDILGDDPAFRGLQVACAGHTGFPRPVVSDPITGGADYVGGDVHLAGCVLNAANPGQFLATGDMITDIGATVVPALGLVHTPLGAHKLRSLSAPLQLHSLSPFERSLPPPRTVTGCVGALFGVFWWILVLVLDFFCFLKKKKKKIRCVWFIFRSDAFSYADQFFPLLYF